VILTPVSPTALPALLDRFAATLEDAAARRAFARLAHADDAERAAGARAAAHRRTALELAARHGMGLREGSPALDFSWDGNSLRTGTEAYVLIHEVAHFQIAPPSRRHLIDFGLGAGPETGDREAADRAAAADEATREDEEAMASLLGILWEAEFGQPALASLLDQNWLEGAGRPGAARHFAAVLERLRAGGFLDAALRPTCHLRRADAA
jgi:hypothetical protein